MSNPTQQKASSTMTQSAWDNPDLKIGGEFVTFDKPGDTVSGTVSAVRAHRFDDGKVVPQILLVTDVGEERTVTCGAIRLKTELAEQRPEAGDHIKITLTEEEKRAGGKTLRHWDVVVTRGGQVKPDPWAATPTPITPAAPAPVSAPAAPAVDPAAAMAALANLTPEQRAALGLPAA